MPALVALLGHGEIPRELREGFTTFFAGPLVRHALLIGVLYGCLYLFGTGIYLDRRENTYCIPLNRCSSLLSGLFSSFGLMWLLGLRPPSGNQLVGAGIILSALAILMASTLRGYRPAVRGLAQRLILFVCAGDTSRSPMAQAMSRCGRSRIYGRRRAEPGGARRHSVSRISPVSETRTSRVLPLAAFLPRIS